MITRLLSLLALASIAALPLLADPLPPPAPPQGYTNTPFIPGSKWRVHDANRPKPPVVTPGAFVSTPAPADAIVLFDGTNLDKWCKGNGNPPLWRIVDGYMEAVPRSGSIRTKDSFGSCQIHVEWASPAPPNLKTHGQARGNSGIIIMGKYEIQVLDSYNNPTYADGQASAIYGQFPPLVNVSRKPGEWQSYDIIFIAPVFKDGKLVSPARATVLHNGVLVHHDRILYGGTSHKNIAPYKPHPEKLPLSLQDHGNPTRYKYIWIRPLKTETP